MPANLCTKRWNPQAPLLIAMVSSKVLVFAAFPFLWSTNSGTFVSPRFGPSSPAKQGKVVSPFLAVQLGVPVPDAR